MTDLLRLSNLAFVGQHEEGDELVITVRSKEIRLPPQCCLLHGLKRNGTKAQRYRDHTVQSQPTVLEIRRQRFVCSECRATHYELLPDIDTQHRVTVRFREHLASQAIALPFMTAASLNGVHETLVRRIFNEHAERVLGDYKPCLPRVLGMDEIYLHRQARFVIGDVANGLMIDMQPSRRETDLRPYFDAMVGRERVEVVCQDMWSGYRKVTQAMFPKAVTVIDKYHVQRTANYGMEVVRKKLYLDLSNKDRISLKRKKALFLSRRGGSTTAAQAALSKVFGTHPLLSQAYDLKERFYDIYESQTRAEAETATNRWLASVPQELERPFKTSIDAINNWRPHILRYFEHRYTSAYIERLNGLIRKMDVAGAGYSFDVLRNKALLKHGHFGVARTTTRPPASRGRPGLVAEFATKLWLPGVRVDQVWTGVPLSTLEADLEAGTF